MTACAGRGAWCEPADRPAVRALDDPVRGARGLHVAVVGVRRRGAEGQHQEPPPADRGAADPARPDQGGERAGAGPQRRQRLGQQPHLPAHLSDRCAVLARRGLLVRVQGPRRAGALAQRRPDRRRGRVRHDLQPAAEPGARGQGRDHHAGPGRPARPRCGPWAGARARSWPSSPRPAACGSWSASPSTTPTTSRRSSPSSTARRTRRCSTAPPSRATRRARRSRS